ncbi:hypothetical protein C2S52_011839 [Perilla frutescens var. hirtella]|nr:hypothetical protein C2S52_011839 [Perilla frutescens var. hirtella]
MFDATTVEEHLQQIIAASSKADCAKDICSSEVAKLYIEFSHHQICCWTTSSRQSFQQQEQPNYEAKLPIFTIVSPRHEKAREEEKMCTQKEDCSDMVVEACVHAMIWSYLGWANCVSDMIICRIKIGKGKTKKYREITQHLVSQSDDPEMVEGTLLRDLQEHQQQLDQVLKAESLKKEVAELKMQEQISKSNDEIKGFMQGVNSRFDNLANTLGSIQLQLSNLDKGKGTSMENSILGSPSFAGLSESNQTRPHQVIPSREWSDTSKHSPPHLPKLDFPRFDGDQPRAWILKCQSYFRMVPNVPDDQKVILATMHFDGKASQWFQNLALKESDLSWEQFLDVVSARFEEIRDAKVITEFNKLKHTGLYTDYFNRFEELKACMLLLNKGQFTEDYFIASFISGLGEDIQPLIHMFKPATLNHAIELGQQQILNLEAMTKKFKGNAKPNLAAGQQRWQQGEKRDCAIIVMKLLQWGTYKSRISYMIMSEEEELDFVQLMSTDEEEFSPTDLEEVPMALNVISREGGFTTMRVYGQVGDHSLHILIDSGSTLSFIRESTARDLGCTLQPTKPLLVKVANGNRMVSSTKGVTGSRLALPLSWTMTRCIHCQSAGKEG